MLDHIFSGIDNFQQEFPAIYRDIEQRNMQNRTMLRSSSISVESDDGWQDYEKIHMIYNPKEMKLRIKGRVHKKIKAGYMLAEMTVQNKQGIIKGYRYTMVKSSFLLVDEELMVKPDDLDGIRVEMKYVFFTLRVHGFATEKVETSQVEDVGSDIIGEGKVLHPVSEYGFNKINIVYFRTDEKGTADYFYDGGYPLKDGNQRFRIHLPIAMQFQLAAEYVLSDVPEITGEAYIYSSSHGAVFFSNWADVKIVPASKWKDGDKKYPSIKEKFNSGYLLVFPQEWKSSIEKDGVQGEDDFKLSLSIQFTCKDGKRYFLEMDSQLIPKTYCGGAKVEIPCLHLLWGCIEKNAEIEVLGKGRVPVSEVQIGEKVLSTGNTYETVCDILTGDEEILKYVKASGQELMVTMDHPIMTEEGWKPARELCAGERILCQDGKFYPVEEIYDEPYYDKVYSLNLEHGEGFFANRIYVGDFKMQNSLKEEDEEISQEILQELEKFKNMQ